MFPHIFSGFTVFQTARTSSILPRRATLGVVALVSVLLAACASDTGGQRIEQRRDNAISAPAQIGQADKKPVPTLPPRVQLLPSVDQPVESRRRAGRAPDPQGLVRVALLAPQTGPSAMIGRGILDAAQLALFTVADERLVLQVYDTMGTAEGAASAAALATAQGADLILGPVFSAGAQAVAPQAAAAGLNMVAFTTDPQVAGPGVYVLGFLVSQQVREIVHHAMARGHRRFAVLAPDSLYGKVVVAAYQRALYDMGGLLTAVEYYAADGSDLEDVARRLADYDRRQQALETQRAQLEAKDDEVSRLALARLEQFDTLGDVDFDAILLPEQGNRLKQVASLLAYYDVDPGRVQLLGTMLWASVANSGEQTLIGGLYPAPSPASQDAFAALFRKTYGYAVPPLASHGFDATALAARLASTGGADPFARENLEDGSGFAGVDGVFRFAPSGLSERRFAIMEVSRTGPRVLSPAPATFQDMTDQPATEDRPRF